MSFKDLTTSSGWLAFVVGFDAISDGFESVVAMAAFSPLVAVTLLPSSPGADEVKAESPRDVVGPLRVFFLASTLWPCLRDLEMPALASGCEEREPTVESACCGLGEASLGWSMAQDKTEDIESLLSGWRAPSGRVFGSFASLDMAAPLG